MQIEGTSSIGLVRENNQDRFTVVRHPDLKKLAGCVVCDGVGGSNAGEVAASIAVEDFVLYFTAINHYASLEDLKIWTRETIDKINSKIFNLANTNKEFRGMSTTMVAVVLSEYGTLYANIGDSRVYIIDHAQKLRQVSSDHSLVNDMVLKGSITSSEAKNHPLRNAVTNALGIYKDVRIDLNEIVSPHQQILLSSDGLHGYVDETIIEDTLNHPEMSVRQKVICLVNEAEKAGGFDNITLIVVDKEKGSYNGTE